MSRATLKLYEIAAEYRALADQLAELDIDQQTIADTLEAEAGGDLVDKAGACIAVARSMEAEAAAVDAVIAQQHARKKALLGRAEWLNDYVLRNLLACNLPEIKRPDFIARVREKPGSVVIDAEGDVPEMYVITETNKRIDKAAILPLLRAGGEVAGCRLVKGHRLEVR